MGCHSRRVCVRLWRQVRHGCDIRESCGSSLLSSVSRHFLDSAVSRERLCSWPVQIAMYMFIFYFLILKSSCIMAVDVTS